MITQALDVIDRFLANVVEKLLVARVHAAAEHEVLPDENPLLVAEIIEIVTLVNTAAPDAQHIHVGVAHGAKQFAILVPGDASRKAVSRNPVAAFGKDRHAVDYKGEAFAGIVALLSELQCAQARALRRLINGLAVDQYPRLASIKRMRAQS